MKTIEKIILFAVNQGSLTIHELVVTVKPGLASYLLLH